MDTLYIAWIINQSYHIKHLRILQISNILLQIQKSFVSWVKFYYWGLIAINGKSNFTYFWDHSVSSENEGGVYFYNKEVNRQSTVTLSPFRSDNLNKIGLFRLYSNRIAEKDHHISHKSDKRVFIRIVSEKSPYEFVNKFFPVAELEAKARFTKIVHDF